MRRTSTCAWRLRPRSSLPCVASRRLSCATTRCTAARSWIGPPGSERSSSLSGRAGGSCRVRSICPRSSSRRSCCSNLRSCSRGTPSRRGSPSGKSGCGSARRPSERRIRCTSTPITPEPSPRSPNAAIASRARSRIAPSEPSCSAFAIARAARRRRSAAASSKPSPSVHALAPPPRASAARKKKRSNTSSNTRRSSGDFASVAASASLKSARTSHGTSRSAANASSSSDVPIATPSPRSSSVKPIRRASRPGGTALSGSRARPRHRAPPRQPHADARGDRVEVGAVLDDDRHRLAERLRVEVLGAEQQQRARPVDRLGDRRRLLEVELAHLLHDPDELARDRLAQLGRVQPHDLQLVLDVRVVEPQVQAAALERLRQLARVVRGQQHDRLRARVDPPQLGDRDLEVGQQLEQHRLELLVGLVDLVDQQHDRLGVRDRRHQRPREQELLAEDVLLHGVPAGARRLRLDPQQLLAVVPLVQRLRLVEPLVALQAHELAAEEARRAPSPAPSCRRRPGPRRAPACRASSRGRRRARSTRPAGSRPSAGRRRPARRMWARRGTSRLR